jgi:hypothetical protein
VRKLSGGSEEVKEVVRKLSEVVRKLSGGSEEVFRR